MTATVPIDIESSLEPAPSRSEGSGQPWTGPALIALLVATGALYLWGLSASGWANAYYSAAVQAATRSWKALFFGSFDSSNFITVDKAPAALWVMGLSARIFGVNSWSILVPEALMGVGSVGLLYATVRRHFSPAAGLLAGVVLALTPVATLMFRFNNPDALLTLLLVGSAYALTRALEDGKTKWIVLSGVLIGFGFLAKMLQAFLIVPPFALIYLVAAPTTFGRRIKQLLLAGAAMVAAGGWWVAIVSLIPAGSRPYIGGSQTNSVIELILGYDGFGRITGNQVGSVGGGPVGTRGRWGATGWNRLFNPDFGGQISWLIPAALILTVGVLWMLRSRPRTDGQRAQVLIWSGWLVVSGAVISLAEGIIHPYYTVVLAPAIGALVGVGAVFLWEHRSHVAARATLAAALLATAMWSSTLLGRSSSWNPWIGKLAPAIGLAATPLVLGIKWIKLRKATSVVAAAALTGALIGPFAYSLNTAAGAHSGALPSAGPPVAGAGFGGFVRGGFGGLRTNNGRAFAPPGGFANGLPQLPRGGNGVLPIPGDGRAVFGAPGGGGLFNGGSGTFTLPGNGRSGSSRQAAGPGGAGFRGGGLGGLLDARAPGSDLVALLQQDSGSYTWVAAVSGANNAAGIQLATDRPVMALGGFNGTDPAPTLAEFQQMVEQGKVHYFIGGGGFGFGRGGLGGNNQVSSWVQQNFQAQTVDGTTVYDLTSPS